MSGAGEAAAESGAALRAAREARKLSLLNAAEELRLTPDQIAAMEAGQFDQLGPAVFARGHLRRYAALLGLPADRFLDAYEAAHPVDAPAELAPPAMVRAPVGVRSTALGRRLAVLVPVVLAAVVAGAWWLQERPRAPAPVVTAPQPVAEAVQAAAPGLEAGAVAGLDAAAPAGPDPERLAFEFTDHCWIEVYDAAGQRLAYELAQRGAALAFPGPAPWRVVLGNVRAVRMSVDGRPVALDRGVVVQNTAALYVDEAGTTARLPAAPQDEP